MPPDIPPLRVLCVDDNRDSADSTAELLRLVGFEAQACYDGPSALVDAASFRPSVCLIDFNMPGMDGDECGARLREQADGPVVLVALTARGDDACRGRMAAAGFDLHLVKPADPHQLLAVVDELFRAWGAGSLRTPSAAVRTGTADPTGGQGS